MIIFAYGGPNSFTGDRDINKDLNDMSREELIDLAFLLGEQVRGYTPLPEWGLTPSESVVFEALHEDRAVSKEALSLALEISGAGPSTYGTIKAFVSKVRRKLREAGAPWKINTNYSIGWSLEKIKV